MRTAAARGVEACAGRRGGNGAAAGGVAAGLVSGGVPGSAFMMLTAGIEVAEGKSYFGDTGAAAGTDAVVKALFGVSATGVASFCARAVHSAV